MFKQLKPSLFGKGRANSKNNAMSRLHFVLVQDRTGLTPAEMTSFKSELMAVLEKYFIVDKKGFDVDYRRDADSTTLLINSPIVVRRDEISGVNVGTELRRSGDVKDIKELNNGKDVKMADKEASVSSASKEKTSKKTGEKKVDAVASA